MALADILTRIDGDTDAEVDGIVSVARQRAEQIVADANARASAHRAEVAAAAHAASQREADTIVVNARLAARDAEVSARRELIDDALAAASDALAALPDGEYAGFLARKIADAARGGESLHFGSADVGRAGAVLAELERVAPGLSVHPAEQAAPFEHGALLVGERVRVDLSLSTIVAEQRDVLEVEIARVLFGAQDERESA